MSGQIPMNGKRLFAVRYRSNRVRRIDYLVVVVCLVFIPSAVLQGILGLDERTTFSLLVPVVLTAILVSNRFTTDKAVPVLVLLLALTGAVASLLSNSFSQLFMGVTLATAVIVGRQLFSTLSTPRVLRMMSWFTLALLVGGGLGIIYQMTGGKPLMGVQVGYRTTNLYLTTFSFSFFGNTIRPSGIFDEPGAFAMYVAIVSMFNDTLRQNRKLNIAIMVLSVFTGSLAGLILFALFLISSNEMKSSRKRSLGVLSMLVAAFLFLSFVFPSNMFTTAIDNFYRDRLLVENGQLVGDNRSNQVRDFFELVDPEILLRGAKVSESLYDTADMSSNPFSITYGYGLLISIPYFILIIWLASSTVLNNFRNSYTSLGLLFLLLQRPYLYHMSWSIMIVATIWLIYKAARTRRRASTEWVWVLRNEAGPTHRTQKNGHQPYPDLNSP